MKVKVKHWPVFYEQWSRLCLLAHDHTLHAIEMSSHSSGAGKEVDILILQQ